MTPVVAMVSRVENPGGTGPPAVHWLSRIRPLTLTTTQSPTLLPW